MKFRKSFARKPQMKFGVRAKLLAGFFSVLALLAVVAIITNFEFNKMNSQYSTSIEDRMGKLNLIVEMKDAVMREQLALQKYMANSDGESLIEFEGAVEDFAKSSKKYLSSAKSAEEKKVGENLVAAEAQYYDVASEAFTLIRDEQTVKVRLLMQEKGNKLIFSLNSAAEDAIKYQQDALNTTSETLSGNVQKVALLIIALSVAAFVIGTVIATYISRMISKPVQLVSQAAKQLADGNLAIEKINVKNTDEIGQLATDFNEMATNLRNIIFQVSSTSEQVAASAEEMMASADQTNSATNQVATAIQEVAGGAELQSKNTEESAKAVGEMSSAIQRVAVTTSTVAESAVDTTKQATLGHDSLEKVIEKMKTINHTTSETNSVIKDLDRKSAEIGKIIEVITGIADQTNLLALNAAIEAARAGEHGKGFAVVADEVRKLAELSRQSASQISSLIEVIQKETHQVVEMMNKGAAEISEGTSLVEDTGRIFDEILKSIENVSSEIQEVSAISEEMSASVMQVNASIEEVTKIARGSVASTAEIASATEEQLASMEEVSSSSASLARLAESLREMVAKFKV
ncbi:MULTISPECIES: methyl-accepting chemotaxis protein [Bacillaceae]|uniref:methyl-accepting chemotaxis protein n=1 Tax=Bacillaceae TaxID=186817 RepID=UPI00119EF002|nr:MULTISPECIES: methyl-accepting chemotaxis protein [Bacillaceae]MCM3124260.1 methyl-accepting chemotaxis protein [Mesobacillus sp. MER 33]MCM3235030.1 methyl-accepting chemotaxis protein [Mesobacillus sp. MER 48]